MQQAVPADPSLLPHVTLVHPSYQGSIVRYWLGTGPIYVSQPVSLPVLPILLVSQSYQRVGKAIGKEASRKVS